MKLAAVLVLTAMLGSGLSGCAPVVRNHGYAPDDAILADVTVGQDTRGSVQRKLGRPSSTGVFTDTGWYYVSTRIESYMYHEPKVADRRVVAVEFDANDLVASVDVFGIEDGRIIDLQTRTTPTHGRQLTILQQILGNLGQLGSGEFLDQ
jgi:outer membrane protein assembly factor BamE (lipoprotein component of BamABCDE complex)